MSRYRPNSRHALPFVTAQLRFRLLIGPNPSRTIAAGDSIHRTATTAMAMTAAISTRTPMTVPAPPRLTATATPASSIGTMMTPPKARIWAHSDKIAATARPLGPPETGAYEGPRPAAGPSVVTNIAT